MKKQELIKHIEDLPYAEGPIADTITINRNWILESIEQLDEPKKVQIPQFVASWIEYCKFTHVNLQHALIVGDVYFYNYSNQKDFSKLKEFLETENNQATFARAWLDGYEVEEEKRYIVKIKNLDSDVRVLKKRNRWYFGGDWDDARDTELKIHTRKELEEAGFGWVFDCQGIKIEEAE